MHFHTFIIPDRDKICVNEICCKKFFFFKHLNTDFISRAVYWCHNFERGITMLKQRTAAQLFLLAVGIAMIGFGLWRGEADTVLSKAIRLCMECVGIG